MNLKNFITGIFILVVHFADAQKTYWEIPHDLFGNGKFEGITLQLGNGNKLVVYTNNTVMLNSGTDFRQIMKSFFENYDVIKDTVDEEASNKVHYFYNPGGKNGLTLIPGRKVPRTLSVVDGKSFVVQTAMDTINIYPRKRNTNLEAAVFSFRVKQIEDLRVYQTSNFINEFIDEVDRQIGGKGNVFKPAGKGYRFYADGTFPSRFSGEFAAVNDKLDGKIRIENANTKNLSFSLSADIQNFKSYFAPSFTPSLDLYIKGIRYKEYLRFAVYWQPVFLFEKNNAGQLQTYRNDFIGLLYEYRRGNADPDKLSFYAPISVAWLARNRGTFFEKNTFNISIGGVKYGAMTLRPSMYFNGLLKNVTPGVQLSAGWGR